MKKKPGLDLRSDNTRQAPTLRELLGRAEIHRDAEKSLFAALPPALTKGVRFVSIREGDLTISAESSTIASQLRLRQHEIMEKLRESDQFQYVWRLQIKVRPARFKQQSTFKKRPLSHENARLLEEEAGHTKDKKLREVLEKLASHVQD